MSNVISYKISSFPEFLTSQNLVELGLYSNINSVYLARVKKTGPQHFKLGRKVLYPKTQVVEFIDHLIKKGDDPNLDNSINIAS